VDDHLPRSAKERVAQHVECIIGDVLYCIMQDDEPARNFDALRDVVDETADDGTGGIYLDPGEWFALIDEVADDLGWDSVELGGSSICNWVEEHASAAVIYLAQNEARGIVDELETFMGDHDFKLSDLRAENSFGWAVHNDEREEDGAQVYEYRRIEGDIDVDVYKYELGDSHTVYFEQHVDG